jgi:hypothetical protein
MYCSQRIIPCNHYTLEQIINLALIKDIITHTMGGIRQHFKSINSVGLERAVKDEESREGELAFDLLPG